MTKEALAITGLTVEQIKTFPDPKAVYKELEAVFDRRVDRYDKADKFYLVGQNPKLVQEKEGK